LKGLMLAKEGDGPPSDVVLPRLAYTRRDWEEDLMANFGEGRDPIPCPDCSRTGFYGPRIDAVERHYRQCRFCGFTQMVGQAWERHLPTAHDCDSWPECARAPYVWWVGPEVESYLCPYCGKRVTVSGSLVFRPAEDLSHPWWKVPQNRSKEYYSRFWENWEVSFGRVFL
jgi:hypothetical protein